MKNTKKTTKNTVPMLRVELPLYAYLPADADINALLRVLGSARSISTTCAVTVDGERTYEGGSHWYDKGSALPKIEIMDSAVWDTEEEAEACQIEEVKRLRAERQERAVAEVSAHVAASEAAA